MAFTPYGYQNPYYPAPMQDNLAQLRQNMMPPQPMMQPVPQQNPVAQGGVQWDSSAPTVYLKQADASGKPSLKIYDLVERAETPAGAQQIKPAEFVTRKEFDALAAIVGEMKGKDKGEKVKEAENDE